MQDLFEKLRCSGLKVTPRRKAIVALFAGADRPLTPREVRDRLLGDFDRCGLPGIYRNLEALAGCGVLCRVSGAGGERRYAFCGPHGHHHHHIICISCGRVGPVDACGYRPGMMIGGFRLVDHELQLKGLCSSCTEKDNKPTRS